MSLEEVGKIYGVTRERIRQVEQKSLKKIRDCQYTENLTIYCQQPEKALKFLKKFKNTLHQ